MIRSVKRPGLAGTLAAHHLLLNGGPANWRTSGQLDLKPPDGWAFLKDHEPHSRSETARAKDQDDEAKPRADAGGLREDVRDYGGQNVEARERTGECDPGDAHPHFQPA